MILERVLGLRDRRAAGGPLAIARTMLAVVAGWVLFRAADLRGAAAMYAGMLGLNGFDFSGQFVWQLERYGAVMLLIAFALIYLAPLFSAGKLQEPLARANPAIVPLFVLSLVKLSAESTQPFLYFKF